LPQVAAPRPFTLRQEDVMPARPARSAWWRLPWVQGMAAAAAVLVCVLAVGGLLLLGPIGSNAIPAEPMPAALRITATHKQTVPEKLAEVEKEAAAEKALEEPAASAPVVEVEKEGVVTLEAERAPSEPTTGEGDRAEVGDTGNRSDEVPAAAPPPLPTAPPAGLAEEEAVAPTLLPAATSPMDTATPSPAFESLAVSVPQLEVENAEVEIKPGLIRVSGRLPLPEGRLLAVELWREDQPTTWTIADEASIELGDGGQFSTRLQTDPTAPDFDLFAVEPGSYQIRLRTVDELDPAEAVIPFDTYGPAPAEPTQAADEQPEPTSTPLPTPQQGARPGVAPPRSIAVGMCGLGLVALLLAGAVGAGVYFLRTRHR
jgi:hypothetical protein